MVRQGSPSLFRVITFYAHRLPSTVRISNPAVIMSVHGISGKNRANQNSTRPRHIESEVNQMGFWDKLLGRDQPPIATATAATTALW